MRLVAIRTPLLFALTMAVAVCAGCNRRTPPKADLRTKVEYFKETQGPTMTPHGRINLQTVQETAAGKIQYETEDGKVWLVDMTKQADGTYRYGTVVETKRNDKSKS